MRDEEVERLREGLRVVSPLLRLVVLPTLWEI